MPRWSYYDEDEERIPEGMRRIGYDADTQTYTFEDVQNGSIWETEPGNRYGELRCVSGARHDSSNRTRHNDDEDRDWNEPLGFRAQRAGAAAKVQKQSDWKDFAPFLLLVVVVLLLVFKAMGASFWPSSPSSNFSSAPQTAHEGAAAGKEVVCGDGQERYTVRGGDSCWIIAERRGMSLYQLKKMNKGIDCDRLMPDTIVCIANEVVDVDD